MKENHILFGLLFRRGASLEKLYNELDLETLEKEDSTGNYAFIKFIKVILQNTFLTLFLLL